jgi:glycosyltransferase involved in cell wall biosynthesis
MKKDDTVDHDLPLELPSYDYVSPGLTIVRPDSAFPNMIVGDTSVPKWRWLRRWVEHNWYTDRRNPDAGFLSRDEAALLYNAALAVRGKPCLEIGCWRGWSTVHLALGSGSLDVVDPILAELGFAESIHQSCKIAGVLDAIAFHPGFSPAAVDALAWASGKRWALIFIDGDHEGEAPRLDAEVAMRHAEDTAMVWFHDLASPCVAAGLDAMRNAGWRTMVYQTMQIMGVAWRGDLEPPEHFPDPNVFWTLPSHLAGYHVSNWKRPTIRAAGGWWPGMTMADRRDAAMMRAQTAEDTVAALTDRADTLRQEVAQRDAQIANLSGQQAGRQTEIAERDAQIANLGGRLAAQLAEAARRDADLARFDKRLSTQQAEIAGFGAKIDGLEAAQQSHIEAQQSHIEAQQSHIEAQQSYIEAQQFRIEAQQSHIEAQQSYIESQQFRIEAQQSHIEAQQSHIEAQQGLFEKQRIEYLILASRMAAWEREDEALAELARFITRKRVLVGLARRSSASKRFEVARPRITEGIDSILKEEFLHWLLRRGTLLGLLCRPKLSGEAIITSVMGRSLRDARTVTVEDFTQAPSPVFRGFEDFTQARSPVFRGFEDFGQAPSPVFRGFEDFGQLPQLVPVGFKDVREALHRIARGFDELRQSLPLASSGTPTLIDHFRAAGWGQNVPPIPTFPGRLLPQCFEDTVLGEVAELAWIKRVMRGWQASSDEDATRAAVARVQNSDLFDASYYARKAGIGGEWIDPAMHYVLVGDTLGLSPSEYFDPGYYSERNPDVVSAGVNRLLHYESFGRIEGRHPLPAINVQFNTERIDIKREDIIIVVHEASRTGAPVLGWNIARHLTNKYNVFVVALVAGPLLKDFESLSAGICYPSEQERLQPIDIDYGLRKLLDKRSFKYAIINSCESRPAIQSLTNHLIPFVMLMHEFASYVYPPESLRVAFDTASEIVFPAQMVANSALETHQPLLNRPIRILTQGRCDLPGGGTVWPNDPLPSVGELERARNNGAFIVLGAGSVDLRKGVDLFLATAMTVRRQADGERVKFLWVGHGYRPEEDMGYSIYLREQLQRSGLEDFVTFLDEVPDLELIYRVADVFLLTSRLDPMPNVSIDAAHRGIPIVCFKSASGTADLLLSDPDTAGGVVDYLDPAAAGHVILSFVRDREYWTRASIATRSLAKSAFDMEKYVEAIDGLGNAASIGAARWREDAAFLSRTDDFDQDIFLGPEPIFESRAQTVCRAVAQAAMHGQYVVRRPTPGFNPLIWRFANPKLNGDNPLAEFIRAGRPVGPWFIPVLRPVEDSALEAPNMNALLHVRLLETDRAADLVTRLQKNRLRFDLLISTDTALKARLLHGALSAFDRGALDVVVAEVHGGAAVGSLSSLLQRSEWRDHEVVGHLHDDWIDRNDKFIDFQWTSLLGGRRPMLDRVLCAFASQFELGLVFPSDPFLPGPEPTTDYPSGGMFWARRATLDQLSGDDLNCSMQRLPQACAAAGLTQAVTHVPGVLW